MQCEQTSGHQPDSTPLAGTVTDSVQSGEQQAFGTARPRALSLTWDLLLMLCWRDIAIKYKQSLLGFFWAIFMPCLIVLAGLVVRTAMSRLTGSPLGPDGVAAILVKSLPWAFVVTALRFATASLSANANLVTRANCPRIVFPLSSVMSALFDFAVALAPLVLILLVMGIPITRHLLWVIPIMTILIALISGISVLLATANLFFRDVKYIVEVLLTFAIFFTPVFYEASMLGPWETWVLLNPVSPLLEGLNSAVVLGQVPDIGWLLYSTAVTAVVAACAWLIFRRYEPVFADCI